MLRPVFAPLALLYSAGINIRHKLFDWGILRSKEFDIPVICVGNLTVGGTGKTPMAEFLIENLEQTHKIALLSLGYKRRTKGFVEVKTTSSFLDVGDEPKQIKLKYPETIVAVCKNRAVGIDEIRTRYPHVDLIILDDGFQHRQVEPWVNILLMDYSRPIYKDKLMPWGSLRDSVSQLYRANFIVVTKCPEEMNPLDMRIVRKNLGLYPYQSLFFSSIVSQPIMPLFPDKATLNVIHKHPAIILAGVASPGTLIENLSQKYDIVDTLTYPDHHAYRMNDIKKLEEVLKHSPKDTIIITTEKDAVKLTNRKKIPESIQQRLYFQPITTTFRNDCSNEFLRKIELYVRTNQKYSPLHS